MLELFKPTWMVRSIYSVTAEELKKRGIKAVLVDLDNTLIAWNQPEATEDSIHWIQTMKKSGIQVMILSNNSGDRIQKVANILEVDYVPRSMKPLTRAFKIAEDKLGLSTNDMVMVGDQLITDILGANRYNLRTILVKPLLASDAWNTKLNRFIELKIMRALINSDSEMKWRDRLDEPIK
ncbi:MAG: YqeG family HAD IIIA-type phosphatase [Staphylococcus equorum]|nr:YqeG family HAD IIIA-type phosphatase [Staphylococcus equorum]